MGRPCKGCGLFIKDEIELRTHENNHRLQERRVVIEAGGLGSGYYPGTTENQKETQSINVMSGEDAQPEQDREKTSLQREFRNNPTRTVDHSRVQGQEQIIKPMDTPQDSGNFICNTCQKQYSAKSSLLRHKKMEHGTEQFACEHCGKKMSRADSKKRHERSCQGDVRHVCSHCKKLCATAQGLKRHLQWHDKTKNSTPQTVKALKPIGQTARPRRTVNSTSVQTPQYRCRRCTQVFDNRHVLYLYRRSVHYNQVGGALQLRPWEQNQVAPPWAGDDALRRVYEANAPLILEQNRLGPIHSVYNFPVTNDVNLNQLMHFAEEVYRQQQRAFRINFSKTERQTDTDILCPITTTGSSKGLSTFPEEGIYSVFDMSWRGRTS